MIDRAPNPWLAERYRLVRPLGRGGMASVWEAEDATLKRRVAVKVLAGRHAGRSDALRRFERETMAIARLQSPHIAQIYDYGVAGGRPYMVMELLSGETLSQRLRRTRRLDVAGAIVLARHLGKALATAHAAGIIHRDLKPGNVFLVRDHGDEIAKLFDFGISKALEPLGEGSVSHGAIVGTPSFMSPEQMRDSSNVDGRTDLWSFGVILYRACSGRMPFGGEDLRQAIVSVVKAPAPSVLSAGAALPAELDLFFARALAKEPGDRFPDALAMAEAFAACAAPRLPKLPPPPPPRRRQPPPLPPPLMAADAQPPLDEEPPTELCPPPRDGAIKPLDRMPASERRPALVAMAALLLPLGIAVTVTLSHRDEKSLNAANDLVPTTTATLRGAPRASTSATRAAARRATPPPIAPPVKRVAPSSAQARSIEKPPRDLFEEPW